MKNRIRNSYISATVFLILFALFTVLVKTVDVKPVGPQESLIGFSTLNTVVFDFFGENNTWHTVSNLIGYVALLIAFSFAFFGFLQLCKKKSVIKIDSDILALGVLYAVTVMAYILFEMVIINYRPVLVEGLLEASYPSSHTILVITILGSAMIQNGRRNKNNCLKNVLKAVFLIAIIVTTVGRVASGLHWLTDVIGAVLLSTFLILMYYSALKHMDYVQLKEEIKK